MDEAATSETPPARRGRFSKALFTFLGPPDLPAHDEGRQPAGQTHAQIKAARRAKRAGGEPDA